MFEDQCGKDIRKVWMRMYLFIFFYVKLNIVFDQKIVTLNAFKCHIKQIKTKKIPEMSLSKSLRGKKNVNSLRLQ